mmetsp:Transcript_107661/g.169992  ORF Transcript_107661/g.169992 Transcript_107661/m.169992 type:complete len:459 (+) Transcript_107661:3-1379(+)
MSNCFSFLLVFSFVVYEAHAANTRSQPKQATNFNLRGYDRPSEDMVSGPPHLNLIETVSSNTKAFTQANLAAPLIEQRQNHSESLALAQDQGSEFPIMMHGITIDPVLIRPSAGRAADRIQVGLIAKNFYGTNLKDQRFTIDIVLSIRWKDPRVIELIPAGLDKLSMAWSQALKLVWMPGIVVANRDIEMYEIISSSVTIFTTGDVVRVERAQVRCLKKYLLEEYPFDTQDLEVRIVSSKYMTSEVVLVPNQNTSGVEENIWGLYALKDWKMIEYVDDDGDLKKSRGALVITLRRRIGKYFDDHLVPAFIMLTISWAVFYFPFANPFITPRLALSILSLLTFTNLMVKSSKELPGSAPFNWNDLFNQQIQALMFATIIFNIVSEIIHHQLDKPTLAKVMNNEAKALIPFASIINIFLVLGLGRYGWGSLYLATILTKTTLVLFAMTYAFYVYKVWHKH